MKLYSALLGALVVVGLFSGCSRETKDPNKNTINEKTGTPQQNAEKYAQAGEQLVNPIHFMQANFLFDRALQLDPNNKRAQFYKAFVASQMANRGILARVEAFVKTRSKEEQEVYNKFLAEFPNSAIRQFLLDNTGKSDIKDEKGVQQYLDELRAGNEQFRQFLKNNKDMKLTLKGNLISGSWTVSRMVEICDANQYDKDITQADGTKRIMEHEWNWDRYDRRKEISFIETHGQITVIGETNEKGYREFIVDVKLPKCEMFRAAEIDLDRADIEAMQHFQAGVMIYQALVNAYDVQGAIAYIDEIKKRDDNFQGPMSDKEVHDFFKGYADAGKLRTNNGLKEIMNMGSDMVAGASFVAKAQGSTLCKNGKDNKDYQVRSHNLIKTDICMDKYVDVDGKNMSVEKLLKKIEELLGGSSYETEVKNNKGNYVATEIAPAQPFLSPVADLWSVAPSEFDRCGNATGGVQDKTIGGYYPRGDGEQFILRNIADWECPAAAEKAE